LCHSLSLTRISQEDKMSQLKIFLKLTTAYLIKPKYRELNCWNLNIILHKAPQPLSQNIISSCLSHYLYHALYSVSLSQAYFWYFCCHDYAQTPLPRVSSLEICQNVLIFLSSRSNVLSFMNASLIVLN
jgi:hypothetical protein